MAPRPIAVILCLWNDTLSSWGEGDVVSESWADEGNPYDCSLSWEVDADSSTMTRGTQAVSTSWRHGDVFSKAFSPVQTDFTIEFEFGV